jgi:anti-sigma regulatory factor (Ser/Thr protein kinase)
VTPGVEATLEVPAEPALALTARQFVASLGRVLGVDEATVDDLRLVASELVANAAEANVGLPLRLSFSHSNGELRVVATGVGPIADGEPLSRRRLLEGLFEGTAFGADGSVRVSVTLPD